MAKPQTLHEFYATNYSKCHVDDSFMASWQGLAYSTHSIQVVALPIQLFTFWLIVKKTPESMESIKNPLLITHFACTLVDMEFCTFSTPYFFFPSFACFGVGLLNVFEISVVLQLIMGAVIAFGMSLTVIYLFEARSSSIPGNRFRIEKTATRVVYYTYQFLFDCSLFFLLTKIPEDQEAAKLKSLEQIPCPTREFFTAPVVVIIDDPVWINFFFTAIGPIIVLHAIFHIFFHSGCCMYYLYFARSKATSTRTRKIQRRFFVGIIVQLAVPFSVIAVPYFIYTIFLLNQKATQGMTNALILVFGLHGIVESLTLILVHHSYREFVFRFVGVNAKMELVDCFREVVTHQEIRNECSLSDRDDCKSVIFGIKCIGMKMRNQCVKLEGDEALEKMEEIFERISGCAI